METVVRRPAQTSRLMNETPVQSPGLRKCMAQQQFPFPASHEDHCDSSVSIHLRSGRTRMHAGLSYGQRFTKEGESRQFGDYSSGVWVTCSDTIGVDSRVPFVPFWEGRRPTEHAAQRSATIPGFPHPHSTTSFSFWIQPVAAVDEDRLRQLKSKYARPEKARGKMAGNCQDSFPFYVRSTGIPQTQDAAFMANSEVSTCR